MLQTRREFSVGLAGAIALTQVGCSSSSLITALDVVSIGATAALPIIQALSAQLGPQNASLATAYCNALQTACSDSVKELASTDSKTVQYTRIAGYFTSVASISLPPGTVSEVLSVISAIGAAVQIVLTEVGGGSASASKKSVALSLEAKKVLSGYQSQAKALGSDGARVKDILSKSKH